MPRIAAEAAPLHPTRKAETVNEPHDFQHRPIGLSWRKKNEGGNLSESLTRRAVIAGQSGIEFLLYVAKRFVLDQCTVRAAGLTYTSLLALVPLLAISFAIFSAFPAFDDLQIKVQAYIFENFVPQVGETVSQHLDGFTKQTGKLTAVGIVFLVGTSIMLLLAISNAFDAIWRAARNRTLAGRLLVYWAVLTLAPLLLGASVSLSGYLFTVAQASGVERFTGPLSGFARFLPLLFQFGGFAILYLIMPNTSVKIRDALLGGFTAALLFEILKKSFGYYVTCFPTYETIYGALATFPIFLIWMYISWLVVLLGAELCAAMPEWRNGQRSPATNQPEKPSHRLCNALAVIHALSVARRTGQVLSTPMLVKLASPPIPNINGLLADLEAARFIGQTAKNQWLLAQDLATTSLYDLSSRLDLEPDTVERRAHEPVWRRRFAEVTQAISNATAQAMSASLKSVLDDENGQTIEALANALDETPARTTNNRRSRILAWLGLGRLGSS